MYVCPVMVGLLCPLCTGCKNKDMGKVLKEIFQTPYFRVVIVSDEESVELCGALKVRHLIISFIMQLAAKSHKKNIELTTTKNVYKTVM